MENNLDCLWEELSAINDKFKLRKKICNDIQSNENRYKPLAFDDPYRLFDLLGGDQNDAELINWARVYTYKEYINESEEFYNEEVESKWDIIKESSKRAEDTGYWYVTGVCILEAGDGCELKFVIGFTEGEVDEVIDTPYKTGDFPNENWVEML